MKIIKIAVILFPFLIFSQNVVTLSASGIFNGGNSDGIGVNARFQSPMGLCKDNAGNIYIADKNNHRIRKYNINTGYISTIAGSTIGDSNGFGTIAQFNQPTGICFDGSNFLYITDSNNYKIKKLNIITSEVTTVTGNGFGSADGNYSVAQFGNSFDLCFVQNNIYIADSYNNKIRKIDLSNQIVSTVAGSTIGYQDGVGLNAKFSSPQGICFDGNESLYISDFGNYKIRKLDIITNSVTTLVGGNQGYVDGGFNIGKLINPRGITYDPLGYLYVVETNSNKIRKIDLANQTISTFAGSGYGTNDGQALNAQFYSPSYICYFDSNNIYLTDSSNNSLRKIYNLNLNTTTFDESINLEIYPNPASDRIHISFSKNIELKFVNLYNIEGQLIKSEKSKILSVVNLVKGTYFVEVATDKGKTVKTILVK